MISRLRAVASLAILAAALSLPTSPALAQRQAPEVKGTSSGLAQDAIRLSQLTIRLWPEFDKPGVLVFLVGQTAADTPVPAELKFTLPQNATVNAIAYIDTAKDILSDQVPHTIDGSNVSVTSPNGNFHIEFYDTSLRTNAALRTYSFTWQQNFTVDQLSWEVQQPAGATGFTVDPPGGSTGTDENGLSVYRLTSGAVAANQAVTISVGYSKQTDSLTVDSLSAGQSSGATTTQPASTGVDNNTLSIVIAAVVLALVVAGVVIMYLRGGFQGIGVRVVGAPAPEPRERKPRGRAAKKLGKKPAPGQRFCPQCGQPARPGDLFCRSCGTKLHG